MAMTGMPLVNRSGPTRDLIFISYSRRDRDWLEWLLIFLKPYTRQNLKIWADPHIEVGGEWRRDVALALSRSRIGVLLVSPHFLASDFIYNEELPPLLERAATGSITLVPILISACDYKATSLAGYQFANATARPLDGMPEAERNPVFVEIVRKIVVAAQREAPEVRTLPKVTTEHEETETLALPAPTGAIAALHGVPGQRPNYLRRQEYLDQLKQALLGAADRAVGITGATPQGARVGLHGMGGIGKTVLAIDLVNDDEIRRAFPDGVFWLTLGQSIEPLRLQGELGAYIVEEAKAFATVNEGRNQLRRLLDGKSCLLVLDDLWRREDAEPFDVLGPQSRLLVTTRDADLLVALGARELPLSLLSQELALDLVASWSGQNRDALPRAASKVAEACGYLPLALALAGARVQAGAPWDEVLSSLQRGRLEFLDHAYGSVFSSLRLSTDALTEFDRDRYFELAVFPEDADIPIEAICTLWGDAGRIEPDVSRDLLRRFHRRALLTLREDGSGISFHDLQHDFLRLNIPSLVKGHTALVDAYRAVAVSGWASGPDDGYFFQHLPRHLAEADCLDELKALLCDYDWLAAKLRATNVTAILADYDLVVHDQDLALIQQALRLSIPALSRDRSQLPGQLQGRLRGVAAPGIEALLAGTRGEPGRPWLCPKFGSLTPPGGPLRQMLVGHSGTVDAVAFLPDGRRGLSGSADNTLRLCDLASGETLRTLEGHSAGVEAVALSVDGSRALSGSDDKTLRLWDLETGETLRTLEGHTSSVNAVAVLPDGRRALSGSSDGTLRLWHLATGETLRTLEGHTSWVAAVVLSADGSHALSGSFDQTLRLWDLATGDTLRTLEGLWTYNRSAGYGGMVAAVALSADGGRALSGSIDGRLRLWDLATGDSLAEYMADAGIGRAAFARNDLIVAGSEDGKIHVLEIREP